jgi:hypothetical protein
LKQLKDEEDRARDIEAEEKAKNNMTYFNGYDKRQNEY